MTACWAAAASIRLPCLIVVAAAGLILLGALEYIRSRVYHILGDRLARRL